MNFTLYLLKIRIEHYRDRLQYLLSFNKPTCRGVVNCSQKLDKLIVKYEKVIINNKKLTYKKAS